MAPFRKRNRLIFNSGLIFVILTTIAFIKNNPLRGGNFNGIVLKNTDFEESHERIVGEFLKQREEWNLSELGNILFKNRPYPKMKNATFKILIWKDGNLLERRHLRYFQKQKHDPFEGCSVNNCVLTYKDGDFEDANAVIFLMHRLRSSAILPDSKTKPPKQRWIFLTDESPLNTFLYSKHNNWMNYPNIFNWSMSYRTESDIPVPYGRTVPLKNEIDQSTSLQELIPNYYKKRRDVLAAIMISNCGENNGRLKYASELQKHVKVDVYGKCGKELRNLCTGSGVRYGIDCPNLEDYMFYLAFENSNCEEYMTEKLFWNSYSKGAVPVVMGASRENCRTLLPPDSYIHINDYSSPLDLARYLLYLNQTWDEWMGFHGWRYHFDVVNEHGYFGAKSWHYCRICEGLNYNSEDAKVYNNLFEALSIENNCDL